MTALSASMWIPWLAKDVRIYEKNGLDVEIVLLRGSGQSSQALLGGSLFAAPVALPQVMLANLNRGDLVNVAHTIAVASSKLVVKPEIKRPEDLRGKKIATSSIGAADQRAKAIKNNHARQNTHTLIPRYPFNLAAFGSF